MRFSSFLVLWLLAACLAVGFAAADDDDGLIGGGTGYFQIASSPSGGSVYFDGSYEGTTPTIVPVSSTGNPSHHIRITKPGYYDWEQTYSGNPFAGETITIDADLLFIPVTQEPTITIGGDRGYYYISSSPSGANVYFDNSYKGTTPLTVTVYTTGTPGHTISVSLPGYSTWTNYYAGNPSPDQTVYVSASLSPVQNYGSISVDTSPTGAIAVLDGGSSQVTPCTFNNVYPGSHSLYVSKSGYQSKTTSASVTAGRNTQVTVYLSQIPPNTGSLYVVSTPQGAGVYVDGNYYGPAPQIVSGMSTGYHAVRLSLSGFQDWTGSVYVTGGETTRVTQTLTVGPTTQPTYSPGTGGLAISSNPIGAQVYLDNNYLGLTPLTSPAVQAGSHVVLLKLSGYADWQGTVQVNSGQVTPVDATLSPSPTPTKSGPAGPLAVLALGILSAFLLFRRR